MQTTDPRDTILRAMAGLFVILASFVIALFLMGHDPNIILPWPSPESGSPAPRAPAAATFRDAAVSEYGIVTATGLVHNNTDRNWSLVEVRAPVYDRDHNLLGYARAYLSDLPAGQTWNYRLSGLSMTGARTVGAVELSYR